MNNLSIRLIIIILALIAVGCETTAIREDSKSLVGFPIKEITFSVRFFSNEKMTIPDSRELPEKFIADFPLLSGTFVGSPNQDVGMTLLLSPDSKVKLELSAIRKKVQNAASEAMEIMNNAGLKIKPNTTRFGRFGTFIHDESSGVGLGASVFIDPRNSKQLLLVYFDRPCEIVGIHRFPDGIAWHWDVTVPKRGFYWLYADEVVEKKEFHLTAASGEVAPILGIRLLREEERVASNMPNKPFESRWPPSSATTQGRR